MPHALKFDPLAQRDIQEITAWYQSRSPRSAERFLLELDIAMITLVQAPFRWPTVRKQSRRYRLGRFPYFILYRVRKDSIEVLGVIHLRRSQGAWRRRL